MFTNSQKKHCLLFFIIILFFIQTLIAEANDFKMIAFANKSYTLQFLYDSEICPADPLFVKMIYSPNRKPLFPNTQETKITISYNAVGLEKEIRKTEFYKINKPETNNKDLTNVFFAGLPTTSWLETGEYEIKIVFTDSKKKEHIFTLPFEVLAKEFNSYTLKMDAKSTSLIADTSTEKAQQSERLNTAIQKYDVTNGHVVKAFSFPSTSKRRTSPFAQRRVYEYTNGKSSTSLHYGLDYGIPIGTPVYACSPGRIVLAENRIVTGNSIVTEILPGLYCLYYHLNEILVSDGDIVKRGQEVAKSGNTGFVTGPHLHWEIRLMMEAVNPDYFVEEFGNFFADDAE